jgi:hypothetical protein
MLNRFLTRVTGFVFKKFVTLLGCGLFMLAGNSMAHSSMPVLHILIALGIGWLCVTKGRDLIPAPSPNRGRQTRSF